MTMLKNVGKKVKLVDISMQLLAFVLMTLNVDNLPPIQLFMQLVLNMLPRQTQITQFLKDQTFVQKPIRNTLQHRQDTSVSIVLPHVMMKLFINTFGKILYLKVSMIMMQISQNQKNQKNQKKMLKKNLNKSCSISMDSILKNYQIGSENLIVGNLLPMIMLQELVLKISPHLEVNQVLEMEKSLTSQLI